MRNHLTGLTIWLFLFGVATWPNVQGDRRALSFAGWLLAATTVYFVGRAIFRRPNVHR